MDVSGISTSVSARNLFAPPTAASDSEQLQRSRGVADKSDDDARHRSRDGVSSRGHALGIFKQELRVRLSTRFDARASTEQKAYRETQAPDTAKNVADAAVDEARQLTAESPPKAASSLITFRAVVSETASYVRESLGERGDYAELDDAIAKVDGAIGELERAASRNVESSASVLSVDARSDQRSTIRIRTQEGDIVKLSLQNSSRLSATDSATSNDGNSTSVTEVQLSSRSRLSLRIDGDLNDSELAAIKNVFDQAEKIANEFFDGDIGAAFNLAKGFEFDSEQLARVKLGFRSQEVSRVAYSESVSVRPQPVVVAAAPSISPVAPSAENDAIVPAEKIAAAEQTPATAIASSALSDFFDTIGAFLRSVSEGFPAAESADSFQLHYSESFKLELLKAAVFAVSPEETEQAANTAAAMIDIVEDGLAA